MLRCSKGSSTVWPGGTCPGTTAGHRSAEGDERGTRATGGRDAHLGRARVQLTMTGCEEQGDLDRRDLSAQDRTEDRTQDQEAWADMGGPTPTVCGAWVWDH